VRLCEAARENGDTVRLRDERQRKRGATRTCSSSAYRFTVQRRVASGCFSRRTHTWSSAKRRSGRKPRPLAYPFEQPLGLIVNQHPQPIVRRPLWKAQGRRIELQLVSGMIEQDRTPEQRRVSAGGAVLSSMGPLQGVGVVVAFARHDPFTGADELPRDYGFVRHGP
jgi:hypothetical protein